MTKFNINEVRTLIILASLYDPKEILGVDNAVARKLIHKCKSIVDIHGSSMEVEEFVVVGVPQAGDTK